MKKGFLFVIALYFIALCFSPAAFASRENQNLPDFDEFKSQYEEFLQKLNINKEGFEGLSLEEIQEIALTDPEPKYRYLALLRLEVLNVDDSIEVIGQVLMRDPFPFIRSHAARIISESGNHEGQTFLIAALKADPCLEVRDFAVYGLRFIGNESAQFPLIEALQRDPELKVQQRAAESLGMIGNYDAEETLSNVLLHATDLILRKVAALALKWIHERYPLSDVGINALFTVYRRDDVEDIRKVVRRVLHEMGENVPNPDPEKPEPISF